MQTLPLLLVALGTAPSTRIASPGDVRTLTLGETVVVEFGVLEDEPVFRVEVPDGATALRVTTIGANYDVELYASVGVETDPYGGLWDVMSAGPWIDEELLITAADSTPLAAGDWYLMVTLSETEIEDDEDAVLTLSLKVELLEPPQHMLVPGRPLELTLDRAGGLRAVLVPEVEASDRARGWRVEVYSGAADVDLLVGPARARLTHTARYASSETSLSWEHIALEPKWLERGARLHIYAYAESESLSSIPVRALLTPLDSLPGLVPELVLPPLTGTPGVRPPLARAVAATVSIYGPLGGGSGVVVSRDGLVLTNAHVVVGAVRGERRRELACGFTTDPRNAPPPAFRLEVVDSRQDLDLALVRIVGALDGTPLPPGIVFPTIELAPPAEVELGQDVHGIGFPMTGGLGSFVTVSLTRGIISGFAREEEGLVFKTDAGIHSGTSGGACVDERGRLIGVPAYTISDVNDNGGLGFVLPLDLLPAAWRERIDGLGNQ
jgi:S1-C subfamily serine protease